MTRTPLVLSQETRNGIRTTVYAGPYGPYSLTSTEGAYRPAPAVRWNMNGPFKRGELRLTEIQGHRNGVSGTGFYAIRFLQRDGRAWVPMLATVFPERVSVAVLCLDLLPHAGVSRDNAWRGDDYEPTLRQWIAESERSAA